jgi:AraC-like DNA-binding protein
MIPSRSEAGIPAHYVRQVAEQVAGAGVDARTWLASHGLAPDGSSAAEAGISLSGFRDLLREALALTGEPALGLLVGARLLVNTHGILGYAAMNAANIRDAAQLFEDYSPLRMSLVTVRHEVVGDEFRILFAEALPLAEVRRPLLEAVMLSVRNVLADLTMGTGSLLRAEFALADAGYAMLAREVFHCSVQYDAPRFALVYPLDLAGQPLRAADPEAFREAAALCRRDLERIVAGQFLADRVRRLLLGDGGNFPALFVVARRLHLTPRTLHRRLVAEGTSYQILLDETRHALAVEYLRHGRLGIKEIAYALGYADIANFRRAFRRWQGVSPKVFRAASGT